MESLKNYFFKLAQKVGRDDCPGLAGEMAYNLILSLIPALIFLTSLTGLLGGQKHIYPLVLDFINRFAPVHTTDMLIGTMNAVIQGSSAGLTIVGFIGSLWSASTGGSVIIKGLQRAYGLSGRKFPFWYNSWLAIVIVLSLGLLLMLATYLIIFGNLIITWLLRHWWIHADLVVWLQGLRWLVVLIGIHGGAAFTYTLVLHPRTRHLAWRKSLPGAWFFVIAWLSVSYLFSLYVEHLHLFNPVYGALGALIILVTWLYYSSLIFFIGGEITSLEV